MLTQTRDLVREGIQWSVREANGALVPGSRGARYLIFDGETIMRRVWCYPERWLELDDDGLWALLDSTNSAGASPFPSRPPMQVVSPTVALAAEASARARSLLAEIMLLREASQSLVRETQSLIAACRDRRADMQSTIESYAAAMRRDGLPPEQALVLIKGAVTEGMGSVRASEDVDAETVVNDAVAWGIAAYYAA